MQYYMLVRGGKIVTSHNGKVLLYKEREINLTDLTIAAVPVKVEGEYPDLQEMLIRDTNGNLYYAVWGVSL